MTQDDLDRALASVTAASPRSASGSANRRAALRTPGRARGHLVLALELLDDQAREHRTHALLPGDEGFS